MSASRAIFLESRNAKGFAEVSVSAAHEAQGKIKGQKREVALTRSHCEVCPLTRRTS